MTRPVCPRLVCLSALAASLITAWGCSASKQAHLQKGNQLYAAGNYEEAALNYRAAIQKDSGFGEAYYRLGLAAIKLNQAGPAYDSLLHAIQLSPGNVDAQKKFTDVCLSLYLADRTHPQSLYNQLSKFADRFIAADHNSYQGWMLKGYLASTDQRPKEAIENFRQALRVNSSDAGVVTELAHLLIQNGQAAEGEQLVSQLIASKKTSYGPAYDLLYSFYLANNRPAQAENVLQAKVANNPKNATYVFDLARHYQRIQNQPAMTAALDRLLNDPKTFPQARLWVGDFYAGQHDYARAIQYYSDGPTSEYQVHHVLALLRQGHKDEALRLAQQIQLEHPKDDVALRLHADLLLAQGKKPAVAVREFEALASKSPGDVSLRMQLGRAYALKGDLDNARKQFVQSLHQNPSLTAARYELAEIALRQQHPQEAVQQAGAILSAQPNDRRARLLYATGLIQTGDAQTARGVLARLINDDSGNERVFAALAGAQLAQKQWDQARKVLNDALIKWPNSVALLQQRADLEAISGHYDAAQAQYEKLLSRDPLSTELLRRLGEVADRTGDHNRAIVYYQRAHDLEPTDATAEIELADALSRANDKQRAAALYQHVAKTHPDNAPALNNAAFFLADSGGNLDEALRLAKQALAHTPGQPNFSDTVGYIYLKKGMLDNAIQSFSTLTRQYPASPIFRYHLGLALYQKGDKAVARKELYAALANHPSAQEALRIRELLNAIS